MPRNKKESTLSRQWELMKLLPGRRPGLTAREVCQRLETAGYSVSKRTVERDLLDLMKVFPMECNRVSEPFGWHWQEGAQFDIPGMDLAEAVSLGLLESMIAKNFSPLLFRQLEARFEAAKQKLELLSDHAGARWSDLVRYVPPGIVLRPPEIVPGILTEVQEALLHREQLEIEYRGASAERSRTMVLHPLGLIQSGVHTYLLATANEHELPIYLALHRFLSAERNGLACQVPPGFTLDRYFESGQGQFGGGERISLKADLSDDLAGILSESRLSPDQKITVHGGVSKLTATVIDSWQLRFWILSQGPAITIRQPVSLKRDILARLEETLANYKPN